MLVINASPWNPEKAEVILRCPCLLGWSLCLPGQVCLPLSSLTTLEKNLIFSSNLEFESSWAPQKDPNGCVAYYPQIPFKLAQISQTAHTTTILNTITLVPFLFKTLEDYVHLN